MNMRVDAAEGAAFAGGPSDAQRFFDAISADQVQCAGNNLKLRDVCDLVAAWLVFVTITFYPSLQLAILVVLGLRLSYGCLFDAGTPRGLSLPQRRHEQLTFLRNNA